jgi:uncharacterized protein (DUF1697 family)
VTQVAFLRAVNVGGRGLVKMTDLQKAFATAGATNVRTVIASGNVIFEAPRAFEPVRARIQENVRALLGAEPVIVFRTFQYLSDLVRAAPFGALVNQRGIKLYVAFLAGTPKRKPAFPLLIPKELTEVRGLHRRDALVVSRQKPNGFYGFPGEWTERELGVAATARNWSTVTRIVSRQV